MSKLTRSLILLLLLITSTATVLIAYNNVSSRNIDPSNNYEIVKEISFDVSNLAPGEKRAETVSLNQKKGFTLYANFKSDEDNLLNQYIIVSINDNNYELKDVLNNNQLEIGKDIDSVVISYQIKEDSDNQSQNQSTSFDLYLEVKR